MVCVSRELMGLWTDFPSGKNHVQRYIFPPFADPTLILRHPRFPPLFSPSSRLSNGPRCLQAPDLPIPQPSVNRFQVLAGQSLQEWEKAGWIWPGDPRGWAEWYVRFWDGRRCEDDERQVKRCELFLPLF